MKPVVSSLQPRRWLTVWKLIGLGAMVWCVAVAMVAIEAVSLSRDANSLRNEMLSALDRPASSCIQFTVGPAVLSVARLGVHWTKGLPDEAVQALRAARSASVGVYTLTDEPDPRRRTRMFDSADRTMARRGWTRVVGVNNASETVAIFAPTESRTDAAQSFCMAVCQSGKLVIVEATADGNSLVELAGRFTPKFALK